MPCRGVPTPLVCEIEGGDDLGIVLPDGIYELTEQTITLRAPFWREAVPTSVGI